MRGQRQGVRSTKRKPKVKIKIEGEENEEKDKETAVDSEEEPALEKEADIYVSVYETKEAMHTDQTGQFPHVSSSGNRYTMVLVELDSNSI